jgi:hypothetical protein
LELINQQAAWEYGTTKTMKRRSSDTPDREARQNAGAVVRRLARSQEQLLGPFLSESRGAPEMEP